MCEILTICQDKPINTTDINVITQKIILAGVMAELWGHRWPVFSVADRGDGAGGRGAGGVRRRVWPPALLRPGPAGVPVSLATGEGGPARPRAAASVGRSDS